MPLIRHSLWLLLASVVACAGDFTPYNEIDRFRVLAVGADHPWLAAGDSTLIRALVVPVEDKPVTYAWSWCPLTQGANSGYECAFTEQELQAQIDAIAPGAFIVPSFNLGTSSTAEFRYSLPPQFFKGACEALQGSDIPAFVELPACDGTFPITIRLTATSNGETIDVVKEILLLYEDKPLNTNPSLTKVEVTGFSGVMGYVESSTTSALELIRGQTWGFRATIDPASVEKYEFTFKDTGEKKTIDETLAITWFIEGGEMDSQRTGYIEGEIDLERAGTNIWETPKVVDYAREDARMFLVIRDNRKGVSWIRRDFKLVAPQ